MKKSTIIIIGIIYVAAIVVIGFFGMNIFVDKEIVYANKIEFVNSEIKLTSSKQKYIEYKYKNGEENSLNLEVSVSPEDASDKSFVFSYDSSRGIIDIDENGAVTIKKKGLITINVMLKINSSVSDTIMLDIY